jgi:hypothetical protein
VDAVDYTWVREYHYEPQQQDAFKDQMVFFFTDGMVTYMPFTHKLAMQKHKSRGTQGDGAAQTPVDFGRPSSVSVKKRKFTDDVAAERCAPNPPPPPHTPREAYNRYPSHAQNNTVRSGCITREALQQQSQTHRRKPQGRNQNAVGGDESPHTAKPPHTHQHICTHVDKSTR